MTMKNQTQSFALDMLNVAANNLSLQDMSNTTFDLNLNISEKKKYTEIDEFFMKKRNYEIYNNNISNINFVEYIETKLMPIFQSYVLYNSTNIGDKLVRYVNMILET